MPTRQRKHQIALGTLVDDPRTNLTIDIQKLIVSRLLIQANSGGGKSWMVRRLLELTYGMLQHIVIDIEGEFKSLRERFDYVIAGVGGDTPAEPRSAALLAERLLTLRVSAIVDLSELSHENRIEFVRIFVDAIVNAPRTLWHPMLLIVDEAHQFCPQDGEVGSSAAVIDACTRGRKRGFCPVLATQRISKLHKDAAAECNNKLIGRATLDVDMKRSGDELGFRTKHERLALRDMEPGEFFVFGPAITPGGLSRIRSGPVLTTHPRPGMRISYKAPKPTKKIRQLLAKLADLPTASEEAGLSTADLKRQLREARAKLARIAEREKREEQKAAVVLDRHLVRAKLIAERLRAASKGILDGVKGLQAVAAVMGVRPASGIPTDDIHIEGVRTDQQRRIIIAIKRAPGGNSYRIGSIAKIPPRVSTFRISTLALKRAGLIKGDRFGWYLTPEGEAMTAHLPPEPTGADALNYFRSKFGDQTITRHIFDVITKAGGKGVTYEDLERETGTDRKVSTMRVALTKLRDINAIDIIGRGNTGRFVLKPEFQVL